MEGLRRAASNGMLGSAVGHRSQKTSHVQVTIFHTGKVKTHMLKGELAKQDFQNLNFS